MGLTDHIFPITDPAILDANRRELVTLDPPNKVYLGCEADITAVGSHTVTEEMKSGLDYIMISSNHFQLPWVDQPAQPSPLEIAQHYVKMFTYACSLDFADVIAHPMTEVSGKFDPAWADEVNEDDLVKAIRLAKKNKIAVEISPRALAERAMDFRIRFYTLCREIGLKFSIGSDAHSLANAGRTAVLGELIKSLNITDSDIWLPEEGR